MDKEMNKMKAEVAKTKESELALARDSEAPQPLSRLRSIKFEQEDGQHSDNKRLISVCTDQIRKLVNHLDRSFFLSRLFHLQVHAHFDSEADFVLTVRILPHARRRCILLDGKSSTTLKIFLGEGLGYGHALSEHILLDAGLISSTKVPKDRMWDDVTVQPLVQAIVRFEDWMQDLISSELVPKGYILIHNKNLGKDSSISQLGSVSQSRDYTKFETFDAALDEFYGKIESQRSEQQQKAKENSASQKLNKIRQDQMAKLIEYNLEDVDSAILAVRVALAKGMN
ncbi:hypothetical protein JHK87_027174 [Glycine soja]|nr:hypothetical protein JHK87_027174 [Glycine soja]